MKEFRLKKYVSFLLVFMMLFSSISVFAEANDVKKKEEVEVTYNTNSGQDAFFKVKKGEKTPSYEYTGLDGVTIIEPTKKGYIFKGWKPKIANRVTVTYKVNGGETLDASITVNKGDKTPGYAYYDFSGAMITEPTREGYTFKGWSPKVADIVTGNTVYTAQWEKAKAERVTVTYKVNGGETLDASITVNKGDKTPGYAYYDFSGAMITEPTREGYTFKGWSPKVADIVTGNTVYTAQWEKAKAERVTVTYKVNGGETLDASITVNKGDKTPGYAYYDFSGAMITEPTREGYTFKGWSPKVADIVTGNTVYTAQWEKAKAERVTVTYKVGSNQDASITVNKGDKTPGYAYYDSNGVMITEPTRAGYTFKGWSPKVADIVTGNTVYTAQWEEDAKEATVTDKIDSDEDISTTRNNADKIPSYEYMSFNGVGVTEPIIVGSAFKNLNLGVAEIATEDIIYEAQWEKEKAERVTVTYKANYGDGNIQDVFFTVKEGEKTPGYEYTTLDGVRVTEPTRAGYTFKGWSPKVADKVTGNTVYTAQWEKVKAERVSVTYKVGSNQDVSITVNKGDKTPGYAYYDSNGVMITEPTREGYVFKGWDPKVADIVTGNTVYTAQWEEKVPEYTVTYKVNGGDTQDASFTVKEGEKTPGYEYTTLDGEKVIEPTRKGYKFIGWNPKVADTVEGNSTYTAQWREVKVFTVLYKVDSQKPGGQDVTFTVKEDDPTPDYGRSELDGVLVMQPMKEGYVFTHWDPEVADTVTENAVYTAQWKKATTHTVLYKVNGNTRDILFDVEEGLSTPDYKYTKLGGAEVTEPMKKGYKFIGWDPKVAATVTENAVYTAQWEEDNESIEPITWGVTYNGNSNTGGTVPIDEKSPYNNGATVTVLDKGNLVKTGYTFKGWNTKADGTGTTYQPDATFIITGNTTLYALWEKDSSGNGGGGSWSSSTTIKPKDIDHIAYIQGYPDKTVRPNNTITKAEVITTFDRLFKLDGSFKELPYKDLNKTWYQDQIQRAYNTGLIEKSEIFNPDEPILRSEVLAMLKKVENLGNKELFQGYEDGTLRLEKTMTRGEFVKSMNNVLGRKYDMDFANPYTDMTKSDWFYKDIIEASITHKEK